MPWFEISMGIVSIIILLGEIYNWPWYWHLSRVKMYRNLFGAKNSRLVTMIAGIGGLSIALSEILHDVFSGYLWLHYIRGVVISVIVTAILFYSHENQSIVDFVRGKDKAE